MHNTLNTVTPRLSPYVGMDLRSRRCPLNFNQNRSRQSLSPYFIPLDYDKTLEKPLTVPVSLRLSVLPLLQVPQPSSMSRLA